MADPPPRSFVLTPLEEIAELPDDQKEQALEQYKLYVGMADKISERRLTGNSFFLGINTAVIALLGFVSADKDPGTVVKFYWFICPAGILLSAMRWRLLKSHRDLGTGKFRVIHEMEKFLPMRPYTAEWSAVGHGKDPKRYKPFTHIEAGVPLIFLLLYAVVLAWNIPWRRLGAYLGIG